MESSLKRGNVKDGRIANREEVKVVRRKSKKLHDAIMRDDGTILSSIPIQASTASIVGTERPFEIIFDLGSPASKQDTEFCCPLPIVQSIPTDVASKVLETSNSS